MNRPARAPKTQPADRPGPLPFVRIDTVVLTVDELERSRQFYRDVLGLKEIAADEEASLIDGGGVQLRLRQKVRAPAELADPELTNRHPAFHVCFTAARIDTLAAAAKATGAVIVVPPTDAPGGVRVCFLKDPDGVLIELSQGELHYGDVRAAVPDGTPAQRSADPRLDHVAVEVKDRRIASERFLTLADFRAVGDLRYEAQKVDIVYLSDGTMRIELFEFGGAGPGSIMDVSQRWRIGLEGQAAGMRTPIHLARDVGISL